MKTLIVMPVINRIDLVNSSLDSIKGFKDILVIDNSSEGLPIEGNFNVIKNSFNIGVGASWNIGLKLGYDLVIIMSATMCFTEEFKLPNADYSYGFDCHQGFHLYGIGKKTIEEVGLFDENFYPAYFEDNDYLRRMDLAGIREKVAYIDLPVVSRGDANSIKAGLPMSFVKQQEYYEKKWGGVPGEERFNKPFDVASLNYWRIQ